MNIGFYIKWDKYSIKSKFNVIGDELWGEALCKSINKQFIDISAELYAPNYLPSAKLDFLIYLNDSEINQALADRHILYLQNGYGEEAEEIIKNLVKYNYDGYVFFSRKMQEIYEKKYKRVDSLYLPFGVDLEMFYPRKTDPSYSFDCSYIGNDIKGEEATMKYIYPAVNFNFGLFGNWKIRRARFKIWENFYKKAPYQKVFEKLSRGKIAQENVPYLYSSTKINLNCTLQSCIDWNVITLRTFEVLACKGFLITDSVPSAQETMKEFMIFTTGGTDLIDKITYYLLHEEERKHIAQKGYEYVIQNCSIDAISKELIQYMKGIVK
jgi:spore maturation protein CgeB